MLSGTPHRRVIAYLTGAHGDWGGASRVIFNCIRGIDRSRFTPLALLLGDGPIVAELERLDVPYLFWGEPHEFRRPAAYVRDAACSLRMLRRHRVDILHINYTNFWRPAEFLAAKLLGIPVISHRHMVIRSPGPWLKRVDLVMAVSQFIATAGAAPSVPTRVVHNAVDLRPFDEARDLRQELGIPQDELVVSFVGQVRELKGVAAFLKVARVLDRPGLTFLLAGECRDQAQHPDAYTPERLRRESGDSPRIRYIGYRTDAPAVFKTSDILLMPSEWNEPLGLVAIEAGAAGIPVVATRSGGIPEVVVDGQTGLLVERGDIEGLTDAARRLIADPALRSRLGQAARGRVQQHFTQAPIRQIEAIYDELVA